MRITCSTKLSCAVAIMMCSLAVAACGSSSVGAGTGASSTAKTSGSGSGKPVKIEYLIQFGNDYEYASANYARAIAKAAGGTLSIANANNNPSTQLNQCLDAISGGYTGLLVWSIDGGGMEYCAKKATAAGIKVVALENPLGPDFADLKPQVSGVTGSVFMPTTYEGAAEVQLVAKACAGMNPCELGYIQGLPNTSYDVSKMAVVRNSLKQYPNIKLVAVGTSGFVASGGLKAAEDMLTAHPGLNVIMSDDDDTSHGAYLAVKKAGKAAQVKIIGVGYGTAGEAAIKAGQQYGSVAYAPRNAADTATAMLIKAIRGQPVSNNAIAEQNLIPSAQRVVTSGNVATVVPQWGPGS
jgi:ribose transport system substrate-binding protein